MRFLIVDLEATCWKNTPDRSIMETIEIGAVMLASAKGPVVDEFTEFVKPVVVPQLSPFCQKLTSIRQSDVDNAEVFSIVFHRFLEWIGSEPYRFCSWGAYDKQQFRLDCKRHQIEYPDLFRSHINLKKKFAQLHNIRPCGMNRALKMMGIPLEGQHHRGIDDARNIAKLGQLILPAVEIP